MDKRKLLAESQYEESTVLTTQDQELYIDDYPSSLKSGSKGIFHSKMLVIGLIVFAIAAVVAAVTCAVVFSGSNGTTSDSCPEGTFLVAGVCKTSSKSQSKSSLKLSDPEEFEPSLAAAKKEALLKEKKKSRLESSKEKAKGEIETELKNIKKAKTDVKPILKAKMATPPPDEDDIYDDVVEDTREENEDSVVKIQSPEYVIRQMSLDEEAKEIERMAEHPHPLNILENPFEDIDLTPRIESEEADGKEDFVTIKDGEEDYDLSRVNEWGADIFESFSKKAQLLDTDALPKAMLEHEKTKEQKTYIKTKVCPLHAENKDNICVSKCSHVKNSIVVSEDNYKTHICKPCGTGEASNLSNTCKPKKMKCNLFYKEPVMIRDEDFYSTKPAKYACQHKCRAYGNFFFDEDTQRCYKCGKGGRIVFNTCRPAVDLCKNFEVSNRKVVDLGKEHESAYVEDEFSSLSVDYTRESQLEFGCEHKCAKENFNNHYFDLGEKKCKHCRNGGVINSKKNICTSGDGECEGRPWMILDEKKNKHKNFVKGGTPICIPKCHQKNNTIWWESNDECVDCSHGIVDQTLNICKPDPSSCGKHRVLDAGVNPENFDPETNPYTCRPECEKENMVLVDKQCYPCGKRQHGSVQGFQCHPDDTTCPSNMVVDRSRVNPNNWHPIHNKYTCTYKCPYHGHDKHIYVNNACYPCPKNTKVDLKLNTCVIDGQCTKPFNVLVMSTKHFIAHKTKVHCRNICHQKDNSIWNEKTGKCEECDEGFVASLKLNICIPEQADCIKEYESSVEINGRAQCRHICEADEVLDYKLSDDKETLVPWCYSCPKELGVTNQKHNQCMIKPDACPSHMYVRCDDFPLQCVPICRDAHGVCNAVWEDSVCKSCGKYAKAHPWGNYCVEDDEKCLGAHQYLDKSILPWDCKSRCGSDEGLIYADGKCHECDPKTSKADPHSGHCRPHLECEHKWFHAVPDEVEGSVVKSYKCKPICSGNAKHTFDTSILDIFSTHHCEECKSHEYINRDNNKCEAKCKNNLNAIWKVNAPFGITALGMGTGYCHTCETHTVADLKANECKERCPKGHVYVSGFIFGGECKPCPAHTYKEKGTNNCVDMDDGDIHPAAEIFGTNSAKKLDVDENRSENENAVELQVQNEDENNVPNEDKENTAIDSDNLDELDFQKTALSMSPDDEKTNVEVGVDNSSGQENGDEDNEPYY